MHVKSESNPAAFKGFALKIDSKILHGFGMFAAKALTISAAVLQGILIANFLGTKGRGMVGLAETFAYTGASFLSLGLPAANCFLISKCRNQLAEVVSNGLIVSLTVGIVGSLLSAIIYRYFFHLDDDFLLLGFVMIPVVISSQMARSIFLGLQNFKFANLTTIASQWLAVAMLIGLQFGGVLSTRSALLVYFLPVLTNAICLYSYLLGKYELKFSVSKKVFGAALKFGSKSFVIGICEAGSKAVPILLIQHFLNVENVAHFSVAVKITAPVLLLCGSFGTVLFASVADTSDKTDKFQTMLKMTGITSVVGITLLLLTLSAAHLFIPALYGADFSGAVTSTKIMMGAALFMSITAIFQGYLSGLGLPTLVVSIRIVGFLITGLLGFLLVHRFGVEGGAISVALAEAFVFCAFGLLIARKRSLA